MARTIRRVPMNWQHPQDSLGRYIPLHDKTYREAFREWQDERTYPEAVFDVIHRRDHNLPSRALCRPTWPQGEKLGYQVYSSVGLMGIPVSPILPSRIEVLAWLIVQGYAPRAANEFIERGFTNSPDHLRSQFGKTFNKFGKK